MVEAVQRYSDALLQAYRGSVGGGGLPPPGPSLPPLHGLKAVLAGHVPYVLDTSSGRLPSGHELRDRLESVGFVRAITLDALDIFIKTVPESGTQRVAGQRAAM